MDCIGRAGGLALFWCEQINIEVRSYSSSHIDVKIMGDRVEDNWRFTGFYGQSLTHRRHESWTLLRQLYEQTNLPWICAGDFNEILSLDEKV